METQNYQFSYIIVYKHAPDRLPLLRKTIAWLHQIPGAEVIIVEQDKTQKLEETDHRARHYIFTQHDGPFEKGWAFNVGTKYATTNTIIFGDSDVIMDPNEFKKALQEFKTKNYDVVNPYKSVVDLQQNENNLPFDKLKSINRPGRGETDHQKVPYCGGITIWKREAVDKVAGWSEDFMGWGAEDDAQSEKVFKMGLKYTTLNYKSYHLFHGRTAPNQQLYFRNLNLLKQVQQMTDQQMLQWINQKRGKIGHLNKYA
jgi:predicted glycosyltransferase involved in capsule biosynthesis